MALPALTSPYAGMNFDYLIKDNEIEFYTKPMDRDELWGREYRRKIYEEEANEKRMEAERRRKEKQERRDQLLREKQERNARRAMEDEHRRSKMRDVLRKRQEEADMRQRVQAAMDNESERRRREEQEDWKKVRWELSQLNTGPEALELAGEKLLDNHIDVVEGCVECIEEVIHRIQHETSTPIEVYALASAVKDRILPAKGGQDFLQALGLKKEGSFFRLHANRVPEFYRRLPRAREILTGMHLDQWDAVRVKAWLAKALSKENRVATAYSTAVLEHNIDGKTFEAILNKDTNATLCICINDYLKSKGLWTEKEVKNLKLVSQDSTVHRQRMLSLWDEYKEQNSGVCNSVRLYAGPKHGKDTWRIEQIVDEAALGPALSRYVPPGPEDGVGHGGKVRMRRGQKGTMSVKSMHVNT